MDFLISVIVPIYNTDEFLSKCIDSIINQTYKKLEIILVNDGSTDRSLEICRDYKMRDSRISVISQTHSGSVNARRLGVSKSSGDFCIFVDSDDWISEDLLYSVVLLSENGTVDVVNYNMATVNGIETSEWGYTVSDGVYQNKTLENIYTKMMFDLKNERPGIIQSLCTKLVKREILQKCMEGVDDRITLGDDAAVVYHAMLMAKKIVVTDKCFYFYRNNPNSMTSTVNEEIFLQISYFQKYMRTIFLRYDSSYRLDIQLQAYIMCFLEKGIWDIFSIKLKRPNMIPLHILRNMGNKIVLYGAGCVGKSFYEQLVRTEEVEIVAWIDRNPGTIYGYKLQTPEIIKRIDFDKVIIAVSDLNMAEEIRANLCVYISNEKIIWGKPEKSWWDRQIIY